MDVLWQHTIKVKRLLLLSPPPEIIGDVPISYPQSSFLSKSQHIMLKFYFGESESHPYKNPWTTVMVWKPPEAFNGTGSLLINIVLGAWPPSHEPPVNPETGETRDTGPFRTSRTPGVSARDPGSVAPLRLRAESGAAAQVLHAGQPLWAGELLGWRLDDATGHEDEDKSGECDGLPICGSGAVYCCRSEVSCGAGVRSDLIALCGVFTVILCSFWNTVLSSETGSYGSTLF